MCECAAAMWSNSYADALISAKSTNRVTTIADSNNSDSYGKISASRTIF